MEVVDKRSHPTEPIKLSYWIENTLEGGGYYCGELERIGGTAEKNSEAIGKLVDMLVSKNLLTLAEVNEIFDSNLEEAK